MSDQWINTLMTALCVLLCVCRAAAGDAANAIGFLLAMVLGVSVHVLQEFNDHFPGRAGDDVG